MKDFTRMKNRTALFMMCCLAGLSSVSSFGDYALEDLKKMEKQVQSAVKRAIPATVSVLPKNFPGSGSGVIVSEDGYILTAAHVIAGGDELSIVFPDGERVEARVLSRNPRRDIALCKTVDDGPYPYVEIGDSKALKVTDILIALGHPGGYDIRRSAPIRIGRVYIPADKGFLVTDCTLVGGDSGGPLIGLDGKVVGIHSSIGGNLSNNNHAPTHAATDHWEDMKAGKDIGRPMLAGNYNPDQPVLGIVLDRENSTGVPITRVVEGSPAEKATLAEGDIIVAFDGENISEYDTFFRLLNDHKPGDEIELTVQRGDEQVTVSVELGRRGDIYGGNDRPPRIERPEPTPKTPAEPAFLGLYFEDGTDQLTVSEAVPGSGAANAKLRSGDKILTVDGEKVMSIDDLREQINSFKPGDELDLRIARNGKKLSVSVTLGRRPADLP